MIFLHVKFQQKSKLEKIIGILRDGSKFQGVRPFLRGKKGGRLFCYKILKSKISFKFF